MEIRLLDNGYKNNESFYKDFLAGKLEEKEEYFSDETIYIANAPDFPIYMAKGSEEEKRQDFLAAFQIITQSYLHLNRDILLDETFWHSLLVTHKRDYILDKYPAVEEDQGKFNNIILKKFDWENYIYKCILAAQYVNDNTETESERDRYYDLILENQDLFNYILKSEIFRNDKFLLNILDIIDELDLSKLAKAKIKGREDLGDDERYGRRVIFEFNKSYPIIMSPMLEKEELKKLFVTYLGYYYDGSPALEPEADVFTEQETKEVLRVAEVAATKDHDFSKPDDRVELQKRESLTVHLKETSDEVAIPNQDNLLIYLEGNNLKYIDHRSKGGSLWVIGSSKIKDYLEPLKESGIHFRFKPVGGRASKFKPAWFWSGEVKERQQ